MYTNYVILVYCLKKTKKKQGKSPLVINDDFDLQCIAHVLVCKNTKAYGNSYPIKV